MGIRTVLMVLLALGSLAIADTPTSKEPKLTARRIAELGAVFGKLKRNLRPRGARQERQLRELANSYSRQDFEDVEQIVQNYFTQGEVDNIPFQYKVAALRAVLDFCSVRRELAIEEMKTPLDIARIDELRQEMGFSQQELETMSQQSKAFRQITMAD